MSLSRTSSSTSGGTVSPPSEHVSDFTGVGRISTEDDFVGLETWEDPTPRPSPFTFEDLFNAFVEASKHQLRLRPKSPSREEMLIRRQEHDRKSLVIALNVYANQNNMLPTELELVEMKERNLIDEYGKGYVHFNFTAKSLDGTIHLLFAEVHPDCREAEDVYHCSALNENDSGHCIGCQDRAKDLVHPSDGGYLGGLKDVGFPFEYYDDSDSAGEDNEQQ